MSSSLSPAIEQHNPLLAFLMLFRFSFLGTPVQYLELEVFGKSPQRSWRRHLFVKYNGVKLRVPVTEDVFDKVRIGYTIEVKIQTSRHNRHIHKARYSSPM